MNYEALAFIGSKVVQIISWDELRDKGELCKATSDLNYTFMDDPRHLNLIMHCHWRHVVPSCMAVLHPAYGCRPARHEARCSGERSVVVS